MSFLIPNVKAYELIFEIIKKERFTSAYQFFINSININMNAFNVMLLNRDCFQTGVFF
jgi:hypothetical protein